MISLILEGVNLRPSLKQVGERVACPDNVLLARYSNSCVEREFVGLRSAAQMRADADCAPGHPTMVQLPDGPITCRELGALTQECLGIPFGRVERWKPPLPPAAWAAPHDATEYGPKCYQDSCFAADGADTGECSEQCLVLNVYAPRDLPPAGQKYPVVVWIHGKKSRIA